MKNIAVGFAAGLGLGAMMFGGWLHASAAPGIPQKLDKPPRVAITGDLKIAETIDSLTTRLDKMETSQAALKKQISELEAAHAKHTHKLPVEFLPPKVLINTSKAIVTPFIGVQQMKNFQTNPPTK